MALFQSFSQLVSVTSFQSLVLSIWKCVCSPQLPCVPAQGLFDTSQLQHNLRVAQVAACDGEIPARVRGVRGLGRGAPGGIIHKKGGRVGACPHDLPSRDTAVSTSDQAEPKLVLRGREAQAHGPEHWRL